MENFVHAVTSVNDAVNRFVWGAPALTLLILTGVLMTVLTRVFQITHFGHWWRNTIGSVHKKQISGHTNDSGSISQFQALCTALSATVGTGNIAGVAAAIATGGPGAVFWMWVAAFFGMMTNYSENGLGSYRHCKIPGRVLSVFFACFAILASFGIGNMSQINSIASNMQSAFHIPGWITGLVLMAVAALIVVGGLQRIASVAEKLVPFMVILYLAGSLIVIFSNIQLIGAALASIFSFAFGFRAVAGAAVGVAVKNAVTMGFKRGVFSNEAGLGSSVMVHSNSNVKEPVVQGMWGIFEVFADTMIVCTLTALVVLTSGLVDLQTGAMLTSSDETVLVADAFSSVFGPAGRYFIAIAILLFAFTTVLGWSHYGTKAWEYLFGTKATIFYKIFFVAFIIVGATMKLDLAWDLSDTFNGLMSIPNLIGVVSLAPLVTRITKNYISRVLHGRPDTPILNVYEDAGVKQ